MVFASINLVGEHLSCKGNFYRPEKWLNESPQLFDMWMPWNAFIKSQSSCHIVIGYPQSLSTSWLVIVMPYEHKMSIFFYALQLSEQ